MSQHVVDAHAHLWNTTEHDWYPALQQLAGQLGQPELYSDFLVDDYRRAAGGLPVTKLGHVSPVTKRGAYLEETEWVDALADAHDLDLVVIGSVDPTMTEAEIVADLERQARSSRFRGV